MLPLNIAEMAEGNAVEGFYAVRDASANTTAQGKPYLRLTLADATGTIQGNAWDCPADKLGAFAAGDIVKLRATVESYRGNPQLKIVQLRLATAADKVDPESFLPATPADVAALQQELGRLIGLVRDPAYAALLRAVFEEPGFAPRFARAPAAKENHHAYLGGLLEHTVSVTRLAEAFCGATGVALDRDLLLAGALLHDIGKVEELGAVTSIEYTDPGRLVGHLVIGCLRIADRARTLPDFPPARLDLLLHMVLSHHGRREYGSPVLPATPEALALHHLDNLDAKTFAARRLINEDANPRNRWTERSWMLETALFKGCPTEAGSA